MRRAPYLPSVSRRFFGDSMKTLDSIFETASNLILLALISSVFWVPLVYAWSK
jgi:hypothetical protein